MTKGELIKILDGLDDDTEIYVVDSKTRYPATARYFRSAVNGGFVQIVRSGKSLASAWTFKDK